MATTLVEYEADVPLAGLPTAGPYRLLDYLNLPDDPRVELIEGRFFVSPAPHMRHQTVVGELYGWLRDAARRAHGFAFTAPTDLLLADDTVVQPDVMYLAPGRRPASRERLTSIPDLLVEVVSKRYERRDRMTKLALYAKAGVPEYWIVDPDSRSFTFQLLKDGLYQVQVAEQSKYASPRCPEVEIDLTAFWAEVDRYVSG